MFKVPENHRIQHPNFPRTLPGQLFGFFSIPIAGNLILFCMATDGTKEVPWEHVSVSIKDRQMRETNRCPTWSEMCRAKDLFWDKDDCVIQFHPPESDYVSHHDYVLHLWRKKGENLETPPSETVGYKKGQKV